MSLFRCDVTDDGAADSNWLLFIDRQPSGNSTEMTFITKFRYCVVKFRVYFVYEIPNSHVKLVIPAVDAF